MNIIRGVQVHKLKPPIRPWDEDPLGGIRLSGLPALCEFRLGHYKSTESIQKKLCQR